MPPRQKRPREVIDLTDDDPTPPRAKFPRTISQSSRPTFSSQASQAHQRYGNSQPSSLYVPSQRLTWQERDDPFDDSEPEVLDLTQADDGPALELYGTVDNKIVGCRYYNGIVSPGEVVVLRREPSNQ